MTTEELNDLYTEIMKSRMGVNPYVSLGANVGGNLISALLANQARRRAQERISSLRKPQRPSMPQFRQNPLLAQRIAQQQQLADQPMMGYQRAMDEQAGRQMERGRQIAAGLGGGAGLAYMQGVSSNVAAQQRQGLLADMAMQARNRAELDQLINMRNQELQQQRSLDAMNYQLGFQDYALQFQDYVRQREGLQADIAQQQANIGAAIGASVADIPQYVQNFRMYNALKNLPKPPPVPKTPVAVTKQSYIPYMQTQSPVLNQIQSPVLNQIQSPALQDTMPSQANPLETQMFSRLGLSGFYSPDSYLNNPSSYLDQKLYIPYMQTQGPVSKR